MKVEKAVTIDRPRAELFRYWRNFENLPRFMDHVKSVSITDNRRSHWAVKGPAGSTIEWDAAIINEKENEMISWKSLENAEVENAGSVWFEPSPDGRGTEVRVVLNYESQQIEHDLRRFKEIMEADPPAPAARS